MKKIFDTISAKCSESITKNYSTSFSTAVKLLDSSIRQDIYNIYGFVRLADEIVDSFHDYDKNALFKILEEHLDFAIKNKISINPVLNSFQETVHKHQIPLELVDAFMHSMKLDLTKKVYTSTEEYQNYIYGSADVVGLMCLKVFVKGDAKKYEQLKSSAMKLGSAFQKVNFLRDLKADFEELNRTYFPETNLNHLDEVSKNKIIAEIEQDFKEGFKGIMQLPHEARFGVYVAYVYYKELLNKLKNTPSFEIKNARIRIPDYQKYSLFAKCYFNYQLNII